jgi:hypothetical protein
MIRRKNEQLVVNFRSQRTGMIKEDLIANKEGTNAAP